MFGNVHLQSDGVREGLVALAAMVVVFFLQLTEWPPTVLVHAIMHVHLKGEPTELG